MFHLVEITSPGTALAIREGVLSVQKKGEEPSFFPLDELTVLLISHPGVNFSGYVPAVLAEKQIPMIFCSSKMTPTGILQSCTGGSSESTLLLKKQMTVLPSFPGRIWQRLICSKISGQAAVLQCRCGENILFSYAAQVKRGDSTGREANAAALYWRTLALFPRRDRFASDANMLFNYVYIILYSIFAREITAAGLFPKLGVHHHHRSDPFPLASDLLEPFRPCMDHIVLDYLKNNDWEEKLDCAVKNHLMQQIYAYRINMKSDKISLFSGCRQVVQSYKKALLAGNVNLLKVPYWQRRGADVVDCCL